MSSDDEASPVQGDVMCRCALLCVAEARDFFAIAAKRHHQKCPLYMTVKYPRLMYYEEAINTWTPVPIKVDGELICTADQLEDGDIIELMFKRVDMTDHEFDSLPED